MAVWAVAFAPSPNSGSLVGSLQASPASALLSSFAPKSVTRRVYPFSIVPGGVASQVELIRIVRSDRVVAFHYASFDVNRAHAVTVAAPRAVHVSYRKGNKVYWTAKKVMLRAGETLLSDGKNEMRTRCANRISDVAQFPVEAHAPSAELLDTAFDEDLADAEEGRRINAAMDLADDVALSWVGEQPQLAGATAGQLASTTIERSAGAAAGAPPPIADLVRSRTVTQFGAAGAAGAVAQADGAAAAGGVSAAPALVVAMDVWPSGGAAPDAAGISNTAASTGSATSSAAVQPATPTPAVTPTPGAAAPVPLATAGDATPKPTELPEPGTAWLVALALGSMLILNKKR